MKTAGKTDAFFSDGRPFMQLIKVPKAGENIEAVTIGRWLKAEGDQVQAGEEVVEILTDKADFALEAEESGHLRRIAAVEKSTVPVGYILGIIAGRDESLPDIDPENLAVMQAAEVQLDKERGKQPAEGPPEPTLAGRKVAATPAARRIAREHGLDLAHVAAALGKRRVLNATDVEEYLKQKK